MNDEIQTNTVLSVENGIIIPSEIHKQMKDKKNQIFNYYIQDIATFFVLILQQHGRTLSTLVHMEEKRKKLVIQYCNLQRKNKKEKRQEK